MLTEKKTNVNGEKNVSRSESSAYGMVPEPALMQAVL